MIPKQIGIYKITSPSGKIYIGQSIDIRKRFRSYKRLDNTISQVKLYDSFKLHGIDKHKFEILCICNEIELDTKEKYFIQYYNCIQQGLNLRSGGSRGRHTEESKKKMSDNNIHKGKVAHNKGKPMSDEQKKLLSDINKGNKHTEEAKIKMSNSRRGKKFSEEHRKALSEAQKGTKHHAYGKKFSEEVKQRMSAGQIRRAQNKLILNQYK
jgi:hypothetical protein